MRSTTPHRKARPIGPEDLALTSDQWHHLRDGGDDMEIVRFHQPHPAFMIA